MPSEPQLVINPDYDGLRGTGHSDNYSRILLRHTGSFWGALSRPINDSSFAVATMRYVVLLFATEHRFGNFFHSFFLSLSLLLSGYCSPRFVYSFGLLFIFHGIQTMALQFVISVLVTCCGCVLLYYIIYLLIVFLYKNKKKGAERIIDISESRRIALSYFIIVFALCLSFIASKTAFHYTL